MTACSLVPPTSSGISAENGTAHLGCLDTALLPARPAGLREAQLPRVFDRVEHDQAVDGGFSVRRDFRGCVDPAFFGAGRDISERVGLFFFAGEFRDGRFRQHEA